MSEKATLEAELLFNIYLEQIVGKCLDGRRRICFGGNIIECIIFADDVVLLAKSGRTTNEILEDLNDTSEEYGMRINTSKTKITVISKGLKQTKIKRGNKISTK